MSSHSITGINRKNGRSNFCISNTTWVKFFFVNFQTKAYDDSQTTPSTRRKKNATLVEEHTDEIPL